MAYRLHQRVAVQSFSERELHAMRVRLSVARKGVEEFPVLCNDENAWFLPAPNATPTRVGQRYRHPWKVWMTGEVFLLIVGIDFEGSPQRIKQACAQRATETRTHWSRTALLEEEAILIQFQGRDELWPL